MPGSTGGIAYPHERDQNHDKLGGFFGKRPAEIKKSPADDIPYRQHCQRYNGIGQNKRFDMFYTPVQGGNAFHKNTLSGYIISAPAFLLFFNFIDTRQEY